MNNKQGCFGEKHTPKSHHSLSNLRALSTLVASKPHLELVPTDPRHKLPIFTYSYTLVFGIDLGEQHLMVNINNLARCASRKMHRGEIALKFYTFSWMTEGKIWIIIWTNNPRLNQYKKTESSKQPLNKGSPANCRRWPTQLAYCAQNMCIL